MIIYNIISSYINNFFIILKLQEMDPDLGKMIGLKYSRVRPFLFGQDLSFLGPQQKFWVDTLELYQQRTQIAHNIDDFIYHRV